MKTSEFILRNRSQAEHCVVESRGDFNFGRQHEHSFTWLISPHLGELTVYSGIHFISLCRSSIIQDIKYIYIYIHQNQSLI